MKPFRKGDRVCLVSSFAGRRPRHAGKVGVITHQPRFGQRVCVLWQGRESWVQVQVDHLRYADPWIESERRRWMDEVKRLLVTGSDADLMRFHVAVAFTANAIERRGQTVFYTVMSADLAAVLEHARLAGVTVQQRVAQELLPGSPADAYWPVVLQGTSPAWSSATAPVE